MKKKVFLIILAVFLFIFILLASIKITKVEVQGNKWYTNQQVEKLIFQNNLSRNSAYCFITNLLGKKEIIPFVQDYKIDFLSPSKVEVIVYEKSIVGYVSYMSSYMYFDKDGIIVESANQKLDGVPWILGLKFGQIILYQPLPVDNFKIFDEILNLTQVLSVNSIDVDKIRYNSLEEATLSIGTIDVLLGDSSEMNGKIAELKNILPKITGLCGTLYLDTYDPNNSALMYTFKKK